jgi:hypothetical protein
MMPTEEQMVALVTNKIEHTKTCNNTPKYDLSTKGKITLVCVCGWQYTVEAGGNDT